MIHICSFTDFADLTIEAAGRLFRFEFSKMFGPMMLGKRGQLLESRPPIRSPFWRALELWCKQGYRVEAGRCVYDVPPPPSTRFVRIAGRHWLQVRPGEEPSAVKARVFKELGEEVPDEPLEITADVDEWAALRVAGQGGGA